MEFHSDTIVKFPTHLIAYIDSSLISIQMRILLWRNIEFVLKWHYLLKCQSVTGTLVSASEFYVFQ